MSEPLEELPAVDAPIESHVAPDQPALEQLPGTQFSRYAVPVEYLPSRDYQPRWGNTKPPIPAIEACLEKAVPVVKEHLAHMREVAPRLHDVPLYWNEGAQPQPCWAGTPLNSFDALGVYSFISKYKPPRYLEIGSGMSTLFTWRAKKDFGLQTEIISIDPQPRSDIDVICDLVIRQGLETCDLSMFKELKAGDVLFFDGSHRSFMNSDVTVFMIDILPNLAPGVIVHIHDIGLPTDYPPMFANWYWNEQYLLAAYMLGAGDRIQPLLPASFVSQRKELFPEHFADPTLIDLGEWSSWTGGGSFWFTQTA